MQKKMCVNFLPVWKASLNYLWYKAEAIQKFIELFLSKLFISFV